MLSWYRDPSISTFVYTEADGISTALFAVKSCNRHHIEEQFVQSNVSKQKWELVFKSSKSKWPYIITKLYLDTCKKPDLGSPQIQYFVFLMIWTNPTKKILTVILIHITHCSIQNFDIKHTPSRHYKIVVQKPTAYYSAKQFYKLSQDTSYLYFYYLKNQTHLKHNNAKMQGLMFLLVSNTTHLHQC